MPRRNKTSQAADRELPTIPEDLIAHFVKGPMTAAAVQDASIAFKKNLIERALGAELGHHLGYPAGAERPAGTANQRNGKSVKTVLTEDGPLQVDIPRDRDGSFDPILIPKHEWRFTAFDDTAEGFPRECQRELADLARATAARGIPVVISNHLTAETRELYRGAECHEVEVRRSVAAQAHSRRTVAEGIFVFKP